jgi:hypothetical protein
MSNSTQSMATIPYTPYISGLESIESEIEIHECVECDQKTSHSLPTMALFPLAKEKIEPFAHERFTEIGREAYYRRYS